MDLNSEYRLHRLVNLGAAFEAKSCAIVAVRQGQTKNKIGQFGNLDADRRRQIVLVLDIVICLMEQIKHDEDLKLIVDSLKDLGEDVGY